MKQPAARASASTIPDPASALVAAAGVFRSLRDQESPVTAAAGAAQRAERH